jgi:hypothetical protein
MKFRVTEHVMFAYDQFDAGGYLLSTPLDFKDMDENSFDVIIFGTGLVESIVAACVLNWLHNWLP